MADLKFDIDIDAISEQFEEIKKKVKQEVLDGVGTLATMTHAKVLELSRDELKSLSSEYSENVVFDNPQEGIWVVTLKSPAMWIEDGRKSGFMEELLSGKSSKVSKDGKRYAVIPFKHNKNPDQQSEKSKQLTQQIKGALKQHGINWGKIEYGADGSPRIGRLHSFNLDSARLKSQHKGPVTHGISVYQTKQSDGSVKRDVMTFRIIHEDHKSEGLWMHPGKTGAKLLDKAFEWALDTWEKDILPNILKDYQ